MRRSACLIRRIWTSSPAASPSSSAWATRRNIAHSSTPCAPSCSPPTCPGSAIRPKRWRARGIAASGGRLEVVSFVRQVAFDLIGGYFGISKPDEGSLALWGSRLFEFQFTGSVRDAAWRAEAQGFAAAFRAHVDKCIAARKAMAPDARPDDVLTRGPRPAGERRAGLQRHRAAHRDPVHDRGRAAPAADGRAARAGAAAAPAGLA